ncbi:MAG: patatin-like phospholipase family protein [Solirubrobacteraceae bacterium]
MTARSSVLELERDRHPAAVALARLAAPAVFIEAELLRSLRLDVLSHVPVSAEAELWLGPLVSSRSPDGITLAPRVAEVLRSELCDRYADPEDRPLLDRAWEVIRSRHRHLSPAIALEERVAWLSIIQAPAEDIEQALNEALKAIATGRRPGLAGWASDAWRRLPAEVKQLPAAWLLRQAVPPALRPAPPPGFEAPEGVAELDLAPFLSEHPRAELPVWRDVATLVLGATTPDDPIAIPIPDTDPIVVAIIASDPDLGERTVKVTLPAAYEQRIGLRTESLRVRNLLGEVYEIPFPRRREQPSSPVSLQVDLALEAPGIKLLALVGAVSEIEARGYSPACIYGCSGGAIVAALLAAGYTAGEIEQTVMTVPFGRFLDSSFLSRLGRAGEATQFLSKLGLHSGDNLLGWVREQLAAKGIRTFADLRDPVAQEPNRRYRLQLAVSDLSEQTLLILPQDASRLGLDPDALEVADVVRMSMSIPVLFEPVQIRDASGVEHLLADGSLCSRFPVSVFDRSWPTQEFPTFGLLTATREQSKPLFSPLTDAPDLSSDLGFARALAEILIEGHDQLDLSDADDARTIKISPLGVAATDFDLMVDRAAAIGESGRAAARQFFETWDFDSWRARYRRPAP